MISFSEAQLLAWLNPILWPFIRTLALFAGMPVFSQRNVPTRVRIGLALFISVAAQPSLPAMPVIPLDSLPHLLSAIGQQLLIGLAMGFAVRVVEETSPRRLVTLVPALMREGPAPGLRDLPVAHELLLHGPYTLDGECFSEPALAAAQLPLKVTASEVPLFAVPGAWSAPDS